jgi:hypothetical protein
VFRTEKRRSPIIGLPYPWIVRSTAMVNNRRITRRTPGSFRTRVVTQDEMRFLLQCGGVIAAHHSMRAALCLVLPISIIKRMIVQSMGMVSIGTRPRSGCKQGGCHDGQLDFIA